MIAAYLGAGEALRYGRIPSEARLLERRSSMRLRNKALSYNSLIDLDAVMPDPRVRG